MIYEAITNTLRSDKGRRFTENDLLDIIKNTLNKELPGKKVDEVAFVNFKTG